MRPLCSINIDDMLVLAMDKKPAVGGAKMQNGSLFPHGSFVWSAPIRVIITNN
jgi:hypothetical protein